MEKKDTDKVFTGTIDQLYDHCSNLDVDELYEECNRNECINFIIKQNNCTRQQAELIYEEISLQEAKNTIDELIRDGLVEITGYNDKNEPLFSLTDLGKKVQAELLKNNSIQIKP